MGEGSPNPSFSRDETPEATAAREAWEKHLRIQELDVEDAQGYTRPFGPSTQTPPDLKIMTADEIGRQQLMDGLEQPS